MPLLLSPAFADALAYAAELHSFQYRKVTGIPYVSHLLAVCSLVLENGGNEEEAIAALLHDAIEDCYDHMGGPQAVRQRLLVRFGEAVVAIVDGCTEFQELPKPDWQTRKNNYIAHLKEAPESVLLVAAADKLHNVRTILADLRAEGDAIWDRFTKTKEDSLWFYREVSSVLSARLTGRGRGLAEELARAVAEMEA